MFQAPAIINLFFEIVIWLVIVRVILSWIPHNPNNAVFRVLYEGTEPILAPFKKIMPKSGFPFDFSPLLALIVLQVLRSVILRMLF